MLKIYYILIVVFVLSSLILCLLCSWILVFMLMWFRFVGFRINGLLNFLTCCHNCFLNGCPYFYTHLNLLLVVSSLLVVGSSFWLEFSLTYYVVHHNSGSCWLALFSIALFYFVLPSAFDTYWRCNALAFSTPKFLALLTLINVLSLCASILALQRVYLRVFWSFLQLYNYHCQGNIFYSFSFHFYCTSHPRHVGCFDVIFFSMVAYPFCCNVLVVNVKSLAVHPDVFLLVYFQIWLLYLRIKKYRTSVHILVTKYINFCVSTFQQVVNNKVMIKKMYS